MNRGNNSRLPIRNQDRNAIRGLDSESGSGKRRNRSVSLDRLAGGERVCEVVNDIGVSLLQLEERPTGHAHSGLEAGAIHLDCWILGTQWTESERVVFGPSRRESMHDSGNGRQSRLGKDRYLRDAICL